MMKRKWFATILLVAIILYVSAGNINTIAVRASECLECHQCPEFLEISFQGGSDPPLYSDQIIKVKLTECDSAWYIIIVIPPSGQQCLQNIIEQAQSSENVWVFLAWLKNSNCNPNIAYKIGKLPNYIPIPPETYEVDLLSYLKDFTKKGGGNPNTDEVGEYKVITLGIGKGGPCAGKCCCICVKCFKTSFNVVPEFPLGTIVPIVSSLSLLGLSGILKKKIYSQE